MSSKKTESRLAPPFPALRELLQTAPEQFVATRKHLVDRLRKQGAKEQAVALTRIRKPSRALWALNQLAVDHGPALEELLGAADEIRSAQARAMEAKPQDAGALRHSLQLERELIGKLLVEASSILARGGHPPDSNIRGRMEATLRGVAFSTDENRQRLKNGTLTEEVQQVGFPAPIDLQAAASSAPPRQRSGRKEHPSPSVEERAAAKNAALKNRQFDIELRQAKRQAEQAQREMQKRLAVAAEAKRKADVAEQTATKVRADAEAANSQAQDAKRRADQAQATVDALANGLRSLNRSTEE